MEICETRGCDQVAQLNVTRTLRVEIKPELIVTERRLVCIDCGTEMETLMGWEIAGRVRRAVAK